MAKHEVHAELAPRLEAYGLDEEARLRLQRLWPLLEPHLPAAIDAFIVEASKIPQIAAPSPSIMPASVSSSWRITGICSAAASTTPMSSAASTPSREHASIGVEARCGSIPAQWCCAG